MRYKIGDHVIADRVGWNDKTRKGVVIATKPQTTFDYIVKCDDGNQRCYYESELSPASKPKVDPKPVAEPTFKVGDRIKLVTHGTNPASPYAGKSGTIVTIFPDNKILGVKFDKGSNVPNLFNTYDGAFRIDECTIEKLTPVPPKAATGYHFKVTAPEEIDVARICNEAPKDCNLLVIKREGLVGVACLVRSEPFDVMINGFTYHSVKTNYPAPKNNGYTFNLPDGWMWISNRVRRPGGNPYTQIPDDQFIARVKAELEKRLSPPPAKKVKKINVKVQYA